MNNTGHRFLILGATLLFVLVLSGANLFLGNLNQDEGWYLVAARACHDGLLPYRDFFFTQAPLMPLIYGRLQALWEPFGLAGARLFTATIGLVAAFFASLMTARAVSRDRRFAAGVTAFLLLAGNVYHGYFTTIPKTYALASLFLAAGFCSVAYVEPGRGRFRSPALAFLGGFLIAAAAATRLSLGLALAVGGCYLLIRARTLRNTWFYYGLGGGLGLLLFLVPFACADLDAFRFANFFHGEREAGGLVFAAGSLSRLIRNYMPLFLLFVIASFLIFTIPASGRGRGKGEWRIGLWCVSFLAVFLLQLFSPFPYDDYQVPLMPLAAAVASALFWRALPSFGEKEASRQSLLLFLVLFLAASFAFTSPMNESWLMVRKDRFWVVSKEMTDLSRLREAAAVVRGETGPDGRLLTTDPYLAIEARLPVYRGLEMGPFGFFPDLSDEEADRYHVYNASRIRTLLSDVTTAPRLVAFSGYGFAVAAPAMTRYPEEKRDALLRELAGRYEPIRAIPDFGQEHTTLELWRRK